MSALKNLSNEQFADLWYLKKKTSRNNKLFINFKPLFSSNYNNGLVVDSVEIFNIPFETSQDSKKLNGLGGRIDFLKKLRILETPFKVLDINLGLVIEDFPSFEGDSIFMQNEISLKNNYFSHPFFVSYAYKKRDFAKRPQFSSESFTFNSFGYKNKIFQSLSASIKKNKYYTSSFQNGDGVKLSFQLSEDKFIISPMLEKYKAKQKTFSFFGKGFFISDNKKKFNLYFMSNKYEDKFYVFGKKRSDKIYIFSMNLPLNKILKKNFFVNIDFIKNNSNIGIYENNEIKFSINLI